MGREYEDLVPKLCPGYDFALTQFAERTREWSSVFELGSGTGNVADAIIKNNPRINYSGVDIDESALSKARKRLGKGLFYFADLKDVAVPNVDVVVSSLAVHHLTHSEQASLFSKISYASKHFLHFELIAPENVQEAKTIADLLDKHVKRESQKLGLSDEELADLKRKSKHLDLPMKLSEHIKIHQGLGAKVEVVRKEYCFVFYSCLYV